MGSLHYLPGVKPRKKRRNRNEEFMRHAKLLSRVAQHGIAKGEITGVCYVLTRADGSHAGGILGHKDLARSLKALYELEGIVRDELPFITFKD